MSEIYLFIIWNRALFCKEKIINDLQNSFVVKKVFYIEWDKNKYKENLKAFYGIKAVDINTKIKNIGYGKFCVIIAEDKNVIYDKRKTYNGDELVNSKIYDKKKLYRKWTAGNFRVHCSQTEEETKHDLVILFGKNYGSIINSIQNNETIYKNTKGVVGFDNFEDLKENITKIDESAILNIDSTISIISKCRKNISLFINALPLNRIEHSITIKNEKYIINIFGEQENDIPEFFIDENKNNKELIGVFFDNANNYKDCLLNYKSLTNDLEKIPQLSKHIYNCSEVETMRKVYEDSIVKRAKNSIMYTFLRIKALFVLLYNK